MASKWDNETAKDVKDWIVRLTKCDWSGGHSADDFHEVLKSGVILCNLANVIKPGSIQKVNTSQMAFKKMENIGFFSDFLTAYGVQDEYKFVTVDLFEASNMPQVLIALKWLKIEAEKKGVK
ncbi:calponin-3-like [Actinia tenebrosa]|uniref:Calponin-3-like n=1 Tax=Actinia tenebrosa TaxID=6105 RepID=A0A6P8IDF2_ACTTE|nr:calponin-3-like [Actinia tenebrosa]